MHATLLTPLPVRPSLGWSVGRLVGPLITFLAFWAHCSYLNAPVTVSITDPAQTHATRLTEYPALLKYCPRSTVRDCRPVFGMLNHSNCLFSGLPPYKRRRWRPLWFHQWRQAPRKISQTWPNNRLHREFCSKLTARYKFETILGIDSWPVGCPFPPVRDEIVTLRHLLTHSFTHT